MKPNINVTPLIDVLLVLLIIFMIVSPLKPSAFKAKVPREPKIEAALPPPDTLVVTVASDLSLTLNRETGLGSTDDTSKLTERLSEVFRIRAENLAYSQSEETDPAFTSEDGIQRTVFIKAPKGLSYGNVAKVVDAVKLAGAVPISLQIDSLE
jgi:biopolymer transport protein ExbD